MLDEVPVFKKNHNAKLNYDEVRYIRNQLAKGVIVKALAIDFKVNETTIHDIKNNKHYKGIY